MKITADIWGVISPFLSTQTLVAMVLVVLAFKVKEVVTRFLSETTESRKKTESRIALLEFRQTKMMAIMVSCPSVTRNNLAWLKDDKRNNKPPEPSACSKDKCSEKK